jgi:hypothetical protein
MLLYLLYTDVWGPLSTIGITGARYYLIFVDHFTKYIWFYPMETKSSVRIIFPQFKNLVENRFQLKIKSVYSDNGGEFVALKHYLQQMESVITPQLLIHRNKTVFLSDVIVTWLKPVSHYYMMHPFHYSIGPMPFPLLHTLLTDNPHLSSNINHSLKFYLHNLQIIKKLKKFDCLCFPLIRPYDTNNYNQNPFLVFS